MPAHRISTQTGMNWGERADQSVGDSAALHMRVYPAAVVITGQLRLMPISERLMRLWSVPVLSPDEMLHRRGE